MNELRNRGVQDILIAVVSGSLAGQLNDEEHQQCLDDTEDEERSGRQRQGGHNAPAPAEIRKPLLEIVCQCPVEPDEFRVAGLLVFPVPPCRRHRLPPSARACSSRAHSRAFSTRPHSS